ncbi:DUF5908 family protein [Aetokthonos hydrillicola Thurmond2011]|jgi:hypothetical protein|uniref:DUF5908 family protein n=1 Tax=Aetokthonos hydrillicola Thurmond2011 TaxID=2712845 RepID=A0AAP5IG17_9CYAN|nr:DUF5908 family protein [Aetokthonos hydrillicola]MBO3460114.1 hypothetical protein [Aetokthonos hydrillicola CCALA 1050]MBW4590734.1 hypothetical protein [Aetokthonos hydrillicola CCALA 1050]MDR9899784.1 DUF5908 family protein [Aetokthonos hydrillicola Thurmond2011]
MPLEIRELVIKASVNDGEQGQNTNQGQVQSHSNWEDDRSDIIATCVEQVLAILKEKSER